MTHRFLIAAAFGTLATTAPLHAQSPVQPHAGHEAPPSATPPVQERPQPACTAEHAAMGHCVMGAREEAPAPAATDPDCPPEHSAMGHCTPRTQATPDAGQAGTALAPGTAPAPRPVAADYADRIWGRNAMLPARDTLRREHGGGRFSRVLIDLAELRLSDGPAGYVFDLDAWYGGDINRFVAKAEGEGTFGEAMESVELKALYSRAIGPYFDLQAGLRQDFNTGPDRTHVALGVAGLAPYWFEVNAYLYLSTKGEVRASASAEYDQRITQRLILQPRIDFALSAQDIPELGIGAGLTSAELGLRLRYEIAREFAPYLGIVHEAKLGQTASIARAMGQERSGTAIVVGLRAWF